MFDVHRCALCNQTRAIVKKRRDRLVRLRGDIFTCRSCVREAITAWAKSDRETGEHRGPART